MSRRKVGTLKKYAEVEGIGERCPKCSEKMERRKRIKPPNNHSYFYKKWDYCKKCHHVQHYDHFKSNEWSEKETQMNFLRSL